jgi:hypothetical protein
MELGGSRSRPPGGGPAAARRAVLGTSMAPALGRRARASWRQPPSWAGGGQCCSWCPPTCACAPVQPRVGRGRLTKKRGCAQVRAWAWTRHARRPAEAQAAPPEVPDQRWRLLAHARREDGAGGGGGARACGWAGGRAGRSRRQVGGVWQPHRYAGLLPAGQSCSHLPSQQLCQANAPLVLEGAAGVSG